MNRITLALVASAAALSAHPALAETRVSIGVNLGGPAYHPTAPAVVYAPPPLAWSAPPAVVVAPPARGYWKEIEVKTWVPERWVISRDRWGRHVRVFEPGYYASRFDRVWVDTSRACPSFEHREGHHEYGFRGGWGR